MKLPSYIPIIFPENLDIFLEATGYFTHAIIPAYLIQMINSRTKPEYSNMKIIAEEGKYFLTLNEKNKVRIDEFKI